MGQNLVEKLVQKYAVDLKPGHVVKSGDYVTIQPAHVMTHDNTGAVIPKFRSIGAAKIANPRQPVFALDHNVGNKSEDNLKKYAKIEKFAAEQGVDFYPAGRGIGHQIMCEEGYAFPGSMMVASDSHSNMYGGLGCLGTPIVRTDAAGLWATGRTWWQVPPVAKINLKGQLKPGVTGKDFIIFLCGFFNNDEVLNHAIEFTGKGVKSLSIDQRLSVANMTTEWGALVGLFPVDEITLEWLKERNKFIKKRGLQGVPSDADGNGEHPRINDRTISELESSIDSLKADDDAFYAKELTIDLSVIQPYVSGPHTLKVMNSVAEIRKKDIKINKAYLVSCVNSRVEDLAEAAKIVKGKKVAPGVKFYIAAASNEVQAESERRGDWQTLLDAGAIPLIPGCGPCIGLGEGLLEDGEVGISATNRNFKGRMGSKNAEAYLASPAVVAASALAGKIDFPGEWHSTKTEDSFITNQLPQEEVSVEILPDFPAVVEGDIVFCHQDNMNTDGIYPGKYTYIDDFTPQQQAEVVMENYDGEFVKLAKDGDILVGGYNFGTGSSREQAATALKYKGIRMVIAGTFSQTYKRNAINNGFLVLESPELTDYLKNKYGSDKLTIATGIKAKVDFSKAELEFEGKKFPLSPVGVAAQELLLAGGLESWVKQKLK